MYVIVGLLLWGFGLFWIGIALTASLYYMKCFQKGSCPVEDQYPPKRLKFNIGFWTIIFPLATLTFATFQLTIYTEFLFFYVMSWIFCGAVLIISLVVHFYTLKSVFFNPDEFWASFR